jgi:hypothetical protein
MGWSSSQISTLSVLHHCGSQQGVQTDSWEICAGLQLDLHERKNTNYSELQQWIQRKKVLTYAIIQICPHCATLIIQFQIPLTYQGRRSFIIWRQNLLSNVTCQYSKIYSKINNVITSLKIKLIIFSLSKIL